LHVHGRMDDTIHLGRPTGLGHRGHRDRRTQRDWKALLPVSPSAVPPLSTACLCQGARRKTNYCRCHVCKIVLPLLYCSAATAGSTPQAAIGKTASSFMHLSQSDREKRSCPSQVSPSPSRAFRVQEADLHRGGGILCAEGSQGAVFQHALTLRLHEAAPRRRLRPV